MSPRLDADHHLHTRFSDGHDSPADMLREARTSRLRTVVLTDHVRRDTAWLAHYTAAVRAVSATFPGLRVVCGVETKILDTAGRLDLPSDVTGVEHVAIADHRFPLADGPVAPEEVAARLTAGQLTAEQVLDALTEATVRSTSAVPAGRGRHLAHLFSVLPKAGLSEDDVGERRIARIADACRATDTAVEINEKWRCPSVRTACLLHRAGVRLIAGSDAHRAADVGAWDYVATIADAIAADSGSRPPASHQGSDPAPEGDT
jgi:putative hydrolase